MREVRSTFVLPIAGSCSARCLRRRARGTLYTSLPRGQQEVYPCVQRGSGRRVKFFLSSWQVAPKEIPPPLPPQVFRSQPIDKMDVEEAPHGSGCTHREAFLHCRRYRSIRGLWDLALSVRYYTSLRALREMYASVRDCSSIHPA